VVEAETLLRRTYAAFNARDVDKAVAAMHPEVDWPNAADGGRLCGREAVRAYWTRQLAILVPEFEPRGFAREEDGRIVVQLDQAVRDHDGTLLFDGQIQHIYTIRDGLIERMDVREAPPG
jgi:hypothetical protein